MDFTHEQFQIFAEFICYSFDTMKKNNWHAQKQADYQQSYELTERELPEFPMSHGMEQMNFDYVLRFYGRGDVDFVLKIWFTMNVFKEMFKDVEDDYWFGNWLNIHHPTCELSNEDFRNYYDTLGIDGLKDILGLNEFTLK